MNDNGKSIGIWIRVSTEEQARGESPAHHEHRARMYAESRGWIVARLYDLSGVSGKSLIDHPTTKEMLADVSAGTITGLVFSKLARFARNTKELLEFADIFKKHGADLISLEEAIDTSTPAGRLFYTVIAAMAQWEREEIAARVKAAAVTRAELGKRVGGAAPYGYRWEDGELQLDPTEAPIRREMFELFRKERKIKAVASRLNEAGHRTRKGKVWRDTAISRLLSDPIVIGKRRANYSTTSEDGKRMIEKPESEWIWLEAPCLVSEELYNECQGILGERKIAPRAPGKKVRHLWSGFVNCQCGERMYPPARTAKYVCRKCCNKISPDDLELVFIEQLKGLQIEPEEVARLDAESNRVLSEKRDLLASTRAERERVRRKAEKLFELHADGEISGTTFGERHRPLEKRLAELDVELPRLEGELDFLEIEQLSGAQVMAEAQQLAETFQSRDQDDKRILVEHTIEEIVIGDDDITIRMRNLRPFVQTATNRHQNHSDSSYSRWSPAGCMTAPRSAVGRCGLRSA